MEPLGSTCLVLSVFATVSNGVDKVPLCWHASQCPRHRRGSVPLPGGNWSGVGGPMGGCQQVGLLVDVAHKAKVDVPVPQERRDLCRFERGRRHVSFVGPA